MNNPEDVLDKLYEDWHKEKNAIKKKKIKSIIDHLESIELEKLKKKLDNEICGKAILEKFKKFLEDSKGDDQCQKKNS